MGISVWPCPCLPCNCSISSDSFAYSGDPNASWTVADGTWSGDGTEMQAGANGLLVNQSAAVNYSTTISVNASGSDGDQILLILNYQDGSNYHYAMFTVGSPGCIELHSVVAGTDTLLTKSSATFTASTVYTLSLFFLASNPDYGCFLSAKLAPTGSGSTVRLDMAGQMELGHGAAIGTKTVASEVNFTAFAWEYANQSAGGSSCPSVTPQCDSYTATLVGCEWLMVSGSFSEVSGTAVPGAAGAEMLLQHVNPFAFGSCQISFTVVMDTTDTVQILFNYVDSNNYNYLEIDGSGGVCSGEKRLYTVAAGVTTLNQISNNSINASQTTYNCTLLFSEGICTASAAGEFDVTIALADPNVATMIGVRCPDAPSADLAITALSWAGKQSSTSTIPACDSAPDNSPCAFCNDLPEPPILKLTFTGVAAGAMGAEPACAAWNDFNTTTFELDRVGPCEWGIGCVGASSLPCGVQILLTINGPAANNWVLSVVSSDFLPNIISAAWTLATAIPTACSGGVTFTSADLSVFSPFGGPYIDFTSATAVVALP